MGGVEIIPLVMGLFGISEVFLNLEEAMSREILTKGKIAGLLPSLQDWGRSIFPILRGSAVGFLLGILPGGGATLGSLASYAIEKKISKARPVRNRND
jgi:putative tricarboxylic transport membrane protein